MQGVVQLALEGPLELGMVQVARMQVEIVGVHRDCRRLELDDDLDAFALVAGGKIQQRVLVEAELGEDAVETSISL